LSIRLSAGFSTDKFFNRKSDHSANCETGENIKKNINLAIAKIIISEIIQYPNAVSDANGE
jgi:hypothetical protein